MLSSEQPSKIKKFKNLMELDSSIIHNCFEISAMLSPNLLF